MQNQEKARLLAERLRAMLARGDSFRRASRELNKSVTALHRLAVRHNMPRRKPNGLSAEKRRTIARLIRGGDGPRAIARKAKVSLLTASRYILKRLREIIGRDAPRRCSKWRCPVGGELLELDRCIQHGCIKPRSVPRGKRNV